MTAPTLPVLPRPWFDGHLDLTYLALHGRDLTHVPATCGGTLQPASITFPSLKAANVRAAVSTLFVRRRTPTVDGLYCFDTPDQAHQAALHQLAMHQEWQSADCIQIAPPQTSTHNPPAPRLAPALGPGTTPLNLTLALEGAACLRIIEDFDMFHAAGVRIVSLAWAEGSHWSGGDQSGGDITPAGRELIRHLDQRHIIHDVSHLSEHAFWTLLDLTQGPVIASHSNCRALLPGIKSPERHLADDQIRVLAQPRGRTHTGIIGINLFARFIIPPDELQHRRATIADLLRHIHHIEQIAGTRACLALGSDMDSGFVTHLLPQDLEGPQHLPRLAEALAQAGWSDPEITHFAYHNWNNLLHDPS